MALATGGLPTGLPSAVLRLACHTAAAAGRNAANLLTLLRLCCVPPIVILVRSGEYHSAAGIFLFAAVTDLADGYVAKRFNGITTFGAVLDPIADKLLMASVFITLAVEGLLPGWIVLLVIGRDLLIAFGTLALRLMVGSFKIEPLLLGKLSTFTQIVLAGAVLAALTVHPPLAAWLDALLIVTAGLVVASAIGYCFMAVRVIAFAYRPR